MTTFTISAIILGVYIVLLGALALKSYLTQSHNGYVIGERKLGLFTTVCSMLAGQFNGGGVFFTFTFGLMVGYGFLWVGFGFLLGYILLSFFAKTVNDESRVYGDVNVPDILNRRIGKWTQHFSSFIIIGKACLFGTAQLLIAGTVIAALFGLPNVWGIFITALIIGSYVYLGGYFTVVKTDVLQWGVLFCITLFALFFLPVPSVGEIVTDIVQVDTTMKWGFVLFVFMLIISNADVWQRMMSAKTGETGQQSLLISGVLFAIFVLGMIIVVKSWGVNSGIGFFKLFEDKLLSPVVLACVGTFTLIAVMSTIDTQVQLFSSALSKNVLQIDLHDHKDKFVHMSRIATILLLMGIAVVASTLGSTLEFVLKAFSFAYILAPIMVISMVWGKESKQYKDTTCVIALLIGLCVYTYMFFNGYFSIMINNVIPSGITALVCLVGMLLGCCFKPKNLVEGRF